MLIFNFKGFEVVVEVGVKEVVFFIVVLELFVKVNINCSFEESLVCYCVVCKVVKECNIFVWGYVLCVIVCFIEGFMLVVKVVYVVKEFYDMGCYEIFFGDIIGVGILGNYVNKIFIGIFFFFVVFMFGGLRCFDLENLIGYL